nr:hypothetical protein GCM10020092_026730 [Actinoplanes digitatis]
MQVVEDQQESAALRERAQLLGDPFEQGARTVLGARVGRPGLGVHAGAPQRLEDRVQG